MKNYAETKKTYSAVHRGDEIEAVEFLASFVKNGNALELGIGTGRIALPLLQMGVSVYGIDISRSTVSLLKKRPQGNKILVKIGDMSDVPIEGKFDLIYVVWNSFYNLPTQELQLKCFKNVAKHLNPNGAFVIEAYMPTFLYKLDNNQYVRAEGIEIDEVGLDVLMHDPSKQIIHESHIYITSKGIELCPVVQRYAWPSELDLMANVSGLTLSERWGNWHKRLFDRSSEIHISVYKKKNVQ